MLARRGRRPGVDDGVELGVLLESEATLCPADPPRDTTMALWSSGGRHPLADEELILALPATKVVRRRTVPVKIVPLDEILIDLLTLPPHAPVGSSVRAWSVAARLALDLVARGRLTPDTTPDGHDTWRLGPLDPDDLRHQAELASALPPEAYCQPLDGSPLRLADPIDMVRAFGDAIADLLPRTRGASQAVGQLTFATSEPQPVAANTDWFDESRPAQHDVAVTLRLCPPDIVIDLVVDLDGSPASSEPTGHEEPFSAELVLQSADDPSLVLSAEDLWDAPDVVMARFADAEDAVLLTLRRAARIWPPLHRLLREARPSRLILTDDECDDLLGPVAADLAAAGLWVHWPVDLLSPLTVKPTVTSPQVERVTDAGLSLDVVLGWRASIDGVDLTPDELEQLAAAKRGVVRMRGRWIQADPATLERLRQTRSLSPGAALGVALGGTLVVDGEPIEADVDGPLADLGQRLAEFDFDRDQPEPEGFKAQLRPYQRRGLAWLAEMATLGLGGILADDMGLGKTIQLLALHLHIHTHPVAAGEQAKPTLVVCPTTLIANWERETVRFAPDVAVRRYHGRDRTLDDIAPDEIVITTYGVVRRDADELAAIDWGIVAADEAQAIKNPLSRSARSMRRLEAGVRFALTGTPVENQLSELWAICDWTTPGILGNLDQFQREVAIPIERHGDADVASWLSTLIRPFVLRRRKTDAGIAPDLPPKTETDRIVPLSAEQATLYKAVVDESLDRIHEAEGIHRRGLVLKLLTELKQICNHPAHYLKQPGPLVGRSAKLDALGELLDIVVDEGAATLVFTQYVEMGRLLANHLDARGLRVLFLHGSLGLTQRQAMVDEFQAGQADVFILSLKAGGTGLNLTEATHVVHYDRWWNPAVEDQASDRAWRIGQDKPVQIHRLICEGTIEDRIATLLNTKRDLADQVVGGGEAWISELDDDDLAALVAHGGPSQGGR
ncbi:MAG: DEAD/DEAH box helicase [Actinomycetia bacterium]|nr:DEAD/DEAH box helicase [Actinomycetes bacterium]